MATDKYVIIASLAILVITSVICYHVYIVQLVFPNLGVTTNTQKDLDSLMIADHPRCVQMKPRAKTSRSTSTPPWIHLLTNYQATVRSGRNLYVWSFGASFFRLGNRLFNYAAVFGIAWRNGRIPIWPQSRGGTYDIAKFFNLRIPTDKNNRVIHVSPF